jgi:hypothetical protein
MLITNLKSAMKRIESTMQGMLVSNFFLSVALGLTMKRIWGIINFLQIATAMPNLKVSLPTNIKLVMQALKDISNIKLIPKELVDKVMRQVSIADDSLGDIGDILIALAGLGAVSIVLAAMLYVSSRFPK